MINDFKSLDVLLKKWQFLRACGTWFTEKTTAATTMCRKIITHTVVAARFWCVYHQCRNTPLQVFIDHSNGNQKALRRHLFPSKKTIQAAETMLQTEFAALCGEKVNIFPAKKALKLRILATQLQELLNIHAKSKKSRAKIEQKISELTSSNSIEVASQMLKSWTQQLQIEEKNLEKDEQKGKTKDVGLEDLVVETSKYLGYQIDRKRTSVAEFAGHLKSFKRHIAAQEKANRKRRK